MDMVVVAVKQLKGEIEPEARALADALGLTLFEARSRVQPPAPRVVATYQDAEEASARAAALGLAGLKPIVLPGASIEHDAQRVSVRSFQLLPDRVILETRTNERHQVLNSEIMLLLSGITSSQQVHVEDTTTRELSLGKAVMSGGMMLTSKKTVKTTTVQEETHSFLHLHAAHHPTFVLWEAELQYQGLGPALQPVRLANYRRILQELRTRAPNAPFDDRLASIGGQTRVLGGILPAARFLDVALSLLVRYLTVAIVALLLLTAASCRSGPQPGGWPDQRPAGVDGSQGSWAVESGSQSEKGDSQGEERRLIMISIDGCRWDYLEDEQLVNLRALRDRGAWASQVKVTNPSMSAPGHISLITGAWSGTHGIVFNKFYDRKLGLVKFFGELPPEQQMDYLLAEPVWVQAEKSGLTTASIHWAATAGKYEGYAVDFAQPFQTGIDDGERLAQATKLFLEERPHLLLVYTLGVSSMTYQNGVGSVPVVQRLRELDGWIGGLVKAVEQSDMAGETDIVVVSDHGFGKPLAKELCLSWVLDQHGIGYDFVVWGAIGHVFLKDQGQAESVKALVEPFEGVERVLLGTEADELHLATQDRTGDVLVVMKQGFAVANMWRPCDGALVDVQPGYESAGTHGYPAEDDEDMRGIFLAAGPHVRHVELGVVRQIDVAPTISALLAIPPPADADGKALDLLVSVNAQQAPVGSASAQQGRGQEATVE